ncbi:MAG: hypothetical protein AAF651_07915 [Cyanobacteria bacterium P01_C01_bin.73]
MLKLLAAVESGGDTFLLLLWDSAMDWDGELWERGGWGAGCVPECGESG